MRSANEDLSWRGGVEDTETRILVAWLSSVFDVSGTAYLAVEEMLCSLPTERVATLDTGTFLDYRPHWSFVMVSDWVSESMEMSELALDRIKDNLDDPVLVLHSAKPDAKWKFFSRVVTELVTRAGVEIVVFFNGMPSGVPHARPTPVHVWATEKAPIPEQPQMAVILHPPTSTTTFLQEWLANRGIPGTVFPTAIPFYVAGAAYPAGASVLLNVLSDLADLSSPAGEFKQGAAEEHTAIERTLESNSEMQRTVATPEECFDALNEVGKDGVPPGEWAERTPLRSERKTEKDIGDVIEAYLTNLTEQLEKDKAEGA